VDAHRAAGLDRRAAHDLRRREDRERCKEEAMRAIDMIGVREDSQVATGGAYSGMLKGHVKLVTEYVFPTLEQAEGQQLVWAGKTVLDGPKPLPFQIKGQGKRRRRLPQVPPGPGPVLADRRHRAAASGRRSSATVRALSGSK
jgi:hypothetical protein